MPALCITQASSTSTIYVLPIADRFEAVSGMVGLFARSFNVRAGLFYLNSKLYEQNFLVALQEDGT